MWNSTHTHTQAKAFTHDRKREREVLGILSSRKILGAAYIYIYIHIFVKFLQKLINNYIFSLIYIYI